MKNLGNFGFIGFCVVFINHIKNLSSLETSSGKWWLKNDADVLWELQYHRVDLHDVYQKLVLPDFPKESSLWASEMELAAFDAANDFWDKIS